MGLTGQILRSEAGLDLLRKLGGAWHQKAVPSLKRTGANFISWTSLPSVANKLLDRSVRKLDSFLRGCQGIFEFTQDDQCILRLSARRAQKEEILAGERWIAPGDTIGEIHLWNEHIVPMPQGGPDMVWGTMMRRRLHRSLIRLAAFVESDPRFADVKIFCGETAFSADKSLDRTRCMASFFGFHITEHVRPGGFCGWWARLGEAIYLWAMVRTFNPGAMSGKTKGPKTVWFQFWLTREILLKKYGSAARHSLSSAATVRSAAPRPLAA